MIISSRPQTPRDVVEEAQLALYNFFMAADKVAAECGDGGVQRIDIQVVKGQFSFSWSLGHDRFHTTFSGQKIEDWSDLPFLPPGQQPYTEADT
jgi:hypothetical protein